MVPLFLFGIVDPGTAAPPGAPLAEPEGASEIHTGWQLEPLGPDGADILEILALEDGRALALTARGELMLWTPLPGGSTQGAWERVSHPRGVGVHLLAAAQNAAGEATPLLLLTNGELLRWIGAPDRGEERIVADPDARRDSLRRATDPHPAGAAEIERTDVGGGRGGFFAHLGRIAPAATQEIVAMVSLERLVEGGILLLGRQGRCYRYRPSGAWESWQARFRDPGYVAHANLKPSGAEIHPSLRSCFVHPADPALLFVLTDWEGLFVSRDGARTFGPVTGTLPKAIGACCPLPGGAICAAGGEGIFGSRDRGQTWTHTIPRGASIGGFIQLSGDPVDPDRLWAIDGDGRLLRSGDGGGSWEPLLEKIPAKVKRLIGWRDEPRLFAGTSRGVLVSADGGDSWHWLNRGLRQVSVLSVAPVPEGSGLLLETDLGYYRSQGDLKEWAPMAVPGVRQVQADHRPALDPTGVAGDRIIRSRAAGGDDHWLGTADGLYLRGADGSWDRVAFAGDEVTQVIVAAENPDAMLCRTTAGIYWSADRGQAWQAVPIPASLPVISLGIEPGGQRVLFGTRYGLFATQPPVPVLQVERFLPVEAFPNPFGGSVLLRCTLMPARELEGADTGHPDSPAGIPPPPARSGPGEGGGELGIASEDADAEPEIRIISVHGQLVRRLRGAELLSGAPGGDVLQWSWDGRTERGQEAPNGIYLASTRVGRQSYVGKIVKFR